MGEGTPMKGSVPCYPMSLSAIVTEKALDHKTSPQSLELKAHIFKSQPTSIPDTCIHFAPVLVGSFDALRYRIWKMDTTTPAQYDQNKPNIRSGLFAHLS